MPSRLPPYAADFQIMPSEFSASADAAFLLALPAPPDFRSLLAEVDEFVSIYFA